MFDPLAEFVPCLHAEMPEKIVSQMLCSADNLVLNPGTGGATLATDELAGGIHYQIVKQSFGALDTVTLVSTATPLPVDLRADNLVGNIDVVIAAALPPGTNNIGDVDVLSVTPGTAATSLGKADDAVHASGDVGVMGLAVRQDTPGNLSGTEGDYEPLQVSAGRLWVSSIVTEALPTGGNTIGSVNIGTMPAVTIGAIVAGDTNIGNVDVLTLPAVTIGTMPNLVESLADDAAFTPATSRVVPGGFTFDDVAPDTVDEGDIGAARMSGNRNQYVQLRDMTAERSAAVTATNALKVDNSAVTQPVSGTVTANAGTGNFATVGDVAHDSPDTGNPQKIGLVARTSHPAAVANADRVNAYGDKLGRVVMIPHVPRELIVHNRIALSSTAETTLIPAGGANVFQDLVFLFPSNESATEARIDIRDATGGTVRLSIDLVADGGGAVVPLPVPLTQLVANNNWTAQLSAGVSTVYLTAIAISQA